MLATPIALLDASWGAALAAKARLLDALVDATAQEINTIARENTAAWFIHSCTGCLFDYRCVSGCYTVPLGTPPSCHIGVIANVLIHKVPDVSSISGIDGNEHPQCHDQGKKKHE